MEFRQLEYFIALAEELSFARAAARLNISQPAVSRQIRLLEEEMTTSLLDPLQKMKYKRVVLTEEGSYFYQEAVKILRQSKELAEGLERLRSRRKTVHLGYTTGLPKAALGAALNFLGARFPDYERRISAYPTAYALEEALRREEIHFATALDTGAASGTVEAIPILEGHLQAAVSVQNPLSEKACLHLGELKNERWAGSVLPLPERVRVIPDFEQLLALTEQNLGISAVPSFYSFGNCELRQIDLLAGGKKLACRQTLVYKKGNASFLVRKLLISC